MPKVSMRQIHGLNELFIVIMVTLLFSFDRPNNKNKIETKRRRKEKTDNRNMYLQKQMSLTHMRGRENGTRVEENVNL